MNRMVRRLTLLALLLAAGSTSAQPVTATRLRGEAEAVRTRKRLTEAQQKLTDNKPAEAADDLQKILDESGDDLVAVKDGQFVPARRLVQQYLAALPANPLATFRRRIDEPARRLLDAGRTARDPRPLEELLERYFVSRPAEDALLLLGELAFERGDFPAAERHWRKLLPDESADELKYPEPKADPTGVKARLILCRLFAGDAAGAEAELAKFRTAHPKAAGPLAGGTGPYADTLAKLIAAKPKVPSDAAGWTTFAGNPARDGRPDAPLPRYWSGVRPWKTPVPRERGDQTRPNPASFPAAKTLAFHPVVLGGFAYLADAGRVYRFDLRDGAVRLAYHAETLTDPPNFDPKDLARPNLQDADFTLTAGGGRVFARLGPAALPTGSDQAKRPRTYLVCLEPKDPLNLEPDALTLTARWQLAPPAAADLLAAWEGAPLWADGRVYAAFVRVENSRLVHAVACYPDSAAGKPLWVTDVCDADANRGTGVKNRHEVLTRAGSNVVFGSHTGVTVALNAVSGKPAWAFRNPPAVRPPNPSPRDLCPPLAAAGKVFVAPADGDALYALDADTGRPAWTSARELQVDQLLGVSRGRLIVTVHSTSDRQTGDQNKGVRAFDAATGSDQYPGGWRHVGAALPTHGRGIAGDDLILWPTQSATSKSLWLLDPDDGRPAFVPQPRIPGVAGNLAFADGVLLVATETELWGYVFDRKQLAKPAEPPAVILGAAPRPAFDPVPVVRPAKTGFDPVAAPSLAEGAKVARTAALPPAAYPLRPLVATSDSRVALTDGKSLLAIDPTDGKTVLRARIDAPAVLTSAAFTVDGGVLAVGPHVVVAVTADGRKRWGYHLPDLELSAFTFAGSRLVMRAGERGLVALDVPSGKVAWTLDSLKRPQVRPHEFDVLPRFGPYLGADGPAVIVQREHEWWRVSADTGQVDHSGETTGADWVTPPAAYKTGVLIPDPTGAVTLWADGREKRLLDPGRPANWTGDPPAVRVFGGDVLAAVSRNTGVEVQRAGDRPWSQSRLLPAGSLDLTHADADPDRYYLPSADRVFAVNRESGRLEWSAPLPAVPDGVSWTLRAGRRAVIAHPTTPATPSQLVPPLRRFAAFPSALRLLGTAASLGDGWANRTLPVLLLDPESGRPAGRVEVPAVGPAASVHLYAETAAVVTTGRIAWLK